MTLSSTTPRRADFPADFAWGTATAAFQIEGGADHRGPTVWDAFVRRPGAVADGDDGLVAADHFHRWLEDVRLIRDLGTNAYRLSLSWSRIVPDGEGEVSPDGLDFYDALVDALLKAGVQPWVTLYHWDFPLPLYHRGGWLNRRSVDWFGAYVEAVADRLGDRVKHWFTLNEPQCFVQLGHALGIHAPGLRLDWPDVLRVAHHALLAHGRAVDVLRERVGGESHVGYSGIGRIKLPATPEPADVEAARVATFSHDAPGLMSNTWFGDAAVHGRYPDDLLRLFGDAVPADWERDMTRIARPIDFYGVSLYKGELVRASEDGPQVVPFPAGYRRTALDWPITPQITYWGPRFLHERYGLPIVVAENGLSCLDEPDADGVVDDPLRVGFIREHLAHLHRAVTEGVPVAGYFHWSLLDNFEWQRGYRERLGLVHVDFSTGRRTPKRSYFEFRDFLHMSVPSPGRVNGRRIERPVG